jgi:MOSC domain-containing protein
MNQPNASTCDVSARIERLFVYPVKSCAGIEVQNFLLTDTGPEFDRAWMVVDARGVFVTQRERPSLALVHPRFAPDELLLSAPGMRVLHVALERMMHPASVTVWDDRVSAFDMGDEAAQWLTDFLASSANPDSGQVHDSYRLVRFDPAYQRISSPRWTGEVQALNQFNDGFPLLVLGTASLELLNQRLVAAGHSSVGIERFRPNVVLSGLQPHEEDLLGVLRIDAGGEQVLLKPVKPCPRCPIPNVDPQTARRSPEVGDLLQSYRREARLNGAVTFGMNAITLRGIGSTLRVGLGVSADFDFE